ncbi:MAG: hypothetical protein H0U76_01415 [Ktedonobacteraceae bacterium]|nr:hypothetical protein [Ktedonobacteraceae bacterium]
MGDSVVGTKKDGRLQKGIQAGASTHDCTCQIQRETVGENHDRTCLLYRQRGSGVSVLKCPRPNTRTTWWSGSGRTGR